MTESKFANIWKYSIRPERKAEFLLNYRPNGSWAKLFSRDTDYLGTELLQSAADENEYLTIDYWKSKTARDRFRMTFSEDFETLDKQCEKYTAEEMLIGDFVINVADGT